MAEKSRIMTPTAFAGRETAEEEREEHRAIKRSGGDVKKAMATTAKRQAMRGRKVAR